MGKKSVAAASLTDIYSNHCPNLNDLVTFTLLLVFTGLELIAGWQKTFSLSKANLKQSKTEATK